MPRKRAGAASPSNVDATAVGVKKPKSRAAGSSLDFMPIDDAVASGSGESNTSRRKFKFLKRRRLAASASDVRNRSAYVAGWFACVEQDPSFASRSTHCPTEAALVGYSYEPGDKEVDRLASVFGGARRSDTQLRRDADVHRTISDDLTRASVVFDTIAHDDGRLAAAGRCASRVGWRQLPAETMRRLRDDKPQLAYETRFVSSTTADADRLDDHDYESPLPGASLLRYFDVTAALGDDVAINCCIMTRHGGGRVSRCLREPTRPLHATLCAKVVKKNMPYFWSKRTRIPAICSFHANVIDSEPRSTDSNPLVDRPLGRHDIIDCVRVTSDAQLAAIAQFVDSALDDEARRLADDSSYRLRRRRLFAAPRSLSPLLDLRRRAFVHYETAGESTSRDDRQMQSRVLLHASESADLDDLARGSTTSRGNLSLAELESRTPVVTTAPIFNSYIDNNTIGSSTTIADDDRLLFKACEQRLLDLQTSARGESTSRLSTLVDAADLDGDDRHLLRVFHVPDNEVAARSPTLNLDALPAATVRRIKKFYNLPNRSGATSKPQLLDGLDQFFAQRPIDDEIAVIADFMRRTAAPSHAAVSLLNGHDPKRGRPSPAATAAAAKRKSRAPLADPPLVVEPSRVVAATSLESTGDLHSAASSPPTPMTTIMINKLAALGQPLFGRLGTS